MRTFSRFFRWALTLLCLAGTGAFASCSTGESVQEALGFNPLSSEMPVFQACKAVSSREISFQFSLPVRVASLNFDPALSVESTSDGTTVTIVLDEALNPGDPVTADLLVEEAAGNTLNVLVPFRARNDRMPRLLITELRIEATKPKSEFVEFKTLEAGNLGALRLFISGNTKKPLTFEFPPVEVKKGEYILVHLRTRDTDTGAVNETGDDLALSGGNEALPDARDFWIPGSNKLLHKTDVVYLMDQDDKVIDAVMMSEKPDPLWSKECFIDAAELLHEQGAWLSADGGIPGPEDAVITANIKTSTTRSISRDEDMDTNRAEDWYITASTTKNPGATPGKKNNPLRFE
jgi:hypothetical protein